MVAGGDRLQGHFVQTTFRDGLTDAAAETMVAILVEHEQRYLAEHQQSTSPSRQHDISPSPSPDDPSNPPTPRSLGPRSRSPAVPAHSHRTGADDDTSNPPARMPVPSSVDTFAHTVETRRHRRDKLEQQRPTDEIEETGESEQSGPAPAPPAQTASLQHRGFKPQGGPPYQPSRALRPPALKSIQTHAHVNGSSSMLPSPLTAPSSPLTPLTPLTPTSLPMGITGAPSGAPSGATVQTLPLNQALVPPPTLSNSPSQSRMRGHPRHPSRGTASRSAPPSVTMLRNYHGGPVQAPTSASPPVPTNHTGLSIDLASPSFLAASSGGSGTPIGGPMAKAMHTSNFAFQGLAAHAPTNPTFLANGLGGSRPLPADDPQMRSAWGAGEAKLRPSDARLSHRPSARDPDLPANNRFVRSTRADTAAVRENARLLGTPTALIVPSGSRMGPARRSVLNRSPSASASLESLGPRTLGGSAAKSDLDASSRLGSKPAPLNTLQRRNSAFAPSGAPAQAPLQPAHAFSGERMQENGNAAAYARAQRYMRRATPPLPPPPGFSSSAPRTIHQYE